MNKLPLCALALLAGCNQITALVGGDKPAADAKAEVKADAKADAKAPDAPPVAAAMPPAPQGPATLDDLLGLVHEGSPNFLVFKTPEHLLAVAEVAAKTFETPLTSFALAAAPGQSQEISQGFALVKSGMADIRAALAQAGSRLERGVVISETQADSSNPVLAFAAASPEAAKGLLTALKMPEADKFTCQAAPSPGYVACSQSTVALAAYKLGDAKAARDRATTALPGVGLDDLAVVGFFDGMHVALGGLTGGAVFHMSAPPDSAEMFTALAAGNADLLRFVQPGTGFLWMRIDGDQIKRNAPIPSGPFEGAMNAFTGEVLLGGSAAPASLQARLGFSDTAPLAGIMALAGGMLCPNLPKKIPDVPGSRLLCEMKGLTLGKESAQALHLALSGVPKAKSIADQFGLSLDAWVFAAEGTLATVFGVDEKSVADVRAPGQAEATLAALPPELATSLKAGEVGFITHIPLDGLQSPALVKLIDDTLAGMPGYQPGVVRLGLGVVSPISSGTMWVTEHGSTGALHFAIQTIGHTGDEEGQAALAAAAAADPAAAFAGLVTKYPSSPRLAAYQARAGQGGVGAIIGGSAPTLLMAAGAMFTLFGATELTPPAELIEAPPVPADPPAPTPTIEAQPIDTPAPAKPAKPKKPAKPAEETKAGGTTTSGTTGTTTTGTTGTSGSTTGGTTGTTSPPPMRPGRFKPTGNATPTPITPGTDR